MSTPHPYAPMTDGKSITYQVQAITGTWNSGNGMLDVSTRTPHNIQKVSFSQIITAIGNFTAAYYHGENDPDLPVNPASTLCDAMAILPNGLHYLGEVKNQIGYIVWPPEMKLTLNPFVGEVRDGVSAVYPNDTAQTPLTTSFAWKYRTIAHYPMYGPFADCWRTSLYEPSNKAVINYVWQRNIGMVVLSYGILNGSSVTGYEYYMIGNTIAQN